jgi:hypothetical protein
MGDDDAALGWERYQEWQMAQILRMRDSVFSRTGDCDMLPVAEGVLELRPHDAYFWTLTVIFKEGYGSRALAIGTRSDLLKVAVDVARLGPAGGPEGGGTGRWHALDGATQRRSVPGGELIILPLPGQALLFHVVSSGACRYLGSGTVPGLMADALPRLVMFMSAPLTADVGGVRVPLRFVGLGNTIAVYEHAEEPLTLMAWESGAVALSEIPGHTKFTHEDLCAGHLVRIPKLHKHVAPRPAGAALIEDASTEPPGRAAADEAPRAEHTTQTSGPNPAVPAADEVPAATPRAERTTRAPGPNPAVPAAPQAAPEPSPRPAPVSLPAWHFDHVQSIATGIGCHLVWEAMPLAAAWFARGGRNIRGTPRQCWVAMGGDPARSDTHIRNGFRLMQRLTRVVSKGPGGVWWIWFEPLRDPHSTLLQWVAAHTPREPVGPSDGPFAVQTPVGSDAAGVVVTPEAGEVEAPFDAADEDLLVGPPVGVAGPGAALSVALASGVAEPDSNFAADAGHTAAADVAAEVVPVVEVAPELAEQRIVAEPAVSWAERVFKDDQVVTSERVSMAAIRVLVRPPGQARFRPRYGPTLPALFGPSDAAHGPGS